MNKTREALALEKYVNEMAQDCILKMAPNEKAALLEDPHNFTRQTEYVVKIKEQYIEHVDARHASELKFEITPDDLAFLVMRQVLTIIQQTIQGN